MNKIQTSRAVVEHLGKFIVLPPNLISLTLTCGVDEVPTIECKYHAVRVDSVEEITKTFELPEVMK